MPEKPAAGLVDVKYELLVKKVRSSPTLPLALKDLARTELTEALQWVEVWRAEDNRGLRKKIALWVGLGLAAEIFILFTLVVAQATGLWLWPRLAFHLDEWAFSVFSTAVLLQTFVLAKLVVSNLFPAVDKDESDVRPKRRGKA